MRAAELPLRPEVVVAHVRVPAVALEHPVGPLLDGGCLEQCRVLQPVRVLRPEPGDRVAHQHEDEVEGPDLQQVAQRLGVQVLRRAPAQREEVGLLLGRRTQVRRPAAFWNSRSTVVPPVFGTWTNRTRWSPFTNTGMAARCRGAGAAGARTTVGACPSRRPLPRPATPTSAPRARSPSRRCARCPAPRSADLQPCATVTVALDAVRGGEADRAVVPIENSVEGSVPVTLDELAHG